MTPEQVTEQVQEIQAGGPSQPVPARDAVNLPMINNWTEAIQDSNPIYVDKAAALAAGHPGLVAPPAMTTIWTMKGLHGERPVDDPIGQAVALMKSLGYCAVVGTNCNQTYFRYIEHGERLNVVRELANVIGPKVTALGDGYFLTARETWFSDRSDGPVAQMELRQLRYKPGDDPRTRGSRREPFKSASRDASKYLPTMQVDVTPTFIVACALATRDFEDVHHDSTIARRRGHPDIFVNIFTGAGLVQRMVTDWAGPACQITSIDLRLGVPCYPHETLMLSGDDIRTEGDTEVISIVGTNSLGKHLNADVRFHQSGGAKL